MMFSETQVIVEVLDVEADPTARHFPTEPRFLLIHARTMTGQLDVPISQAAAAELKEALERHLQAGGSP